METLKDQFMSSQASQPPIAKPSSSQEGGPINKFEYLAGKSQNPYDDDMDTISTTSPAPVMEDFWDSMIEIQAAKTRRSPSDESAKGKDKVT